MLSLLLEFCIAPRPGKQQGWHGEATEGEDWGSIPCLSAGSRLDGGKESTDGHCTPALCWSRTTNRCSLNVIMLFCFICLIVQRNNNYSAIIEFVCWQHCDIQHKLRNYSTHVIMKAAIYTNNGANDRCPLHCKGVGRYGDRSAGVMIKTLQEYLLNTVYKTK